MKVYEIYSWFSNKNNEGYGSFVSKKDAEENNLELIMETMTKNELIESGLFEVLNFNNN